MTSDRVSTRVFAKDNILNPRINCKRDSRGVESDLLRPPSFCVDISTALKSVEVDGAKTDRFDSLGPA